jgi:hypothetical protein
VSTLEETLLGASMLCAMRLRYNYRGYESPEKAKAALRRRCRGITRQQLEDAFSRGAALYERAEEVVWANRRHISAEDLGDLESQLLREFPPVGVGAVSNALKWAYYWRILR